MSQGALAAVSRRSSQGMSSGASGCPEDGFEACSSLPVVE
jgi:hypothetical protein